MQETISEQSLNQTMETGSEHATNMVEYATSAVKHGALDASKAATDAALITSQMFSKGIYHSCYYLAFGTVFSALYVANLLPPTGAVALGIRDGATAAREAFDKNQAQQIEASEPLAPATEAAVLA